MLLVDNIGYDRPERIVLSGENGPYPPLAVNVAETVTAANEGSIFLWYPEDHGTTDQHRRTIDEYQSELAAMLFVPVHGEPLRTDGGQPSRPDLLVRRGADDGLRDALFNDRPVFPSPGCTTVTVYPHESRRPGLTRRLLERITF